VPEAGQALDRTTDHPSITTPDVADHLADLVAGHDEHWDAAKACLPPGHLPESAQTLSPDVIESMAPGIRRILEYQGAAEYIAEKKDRRPWLEPAADAPPAVQRIFAAIDQGAGHAHIRHGPMGDDEMYARRVAYLEDPAQPDSRLRAASVDGLRPGKMHRCADTATRINDAAAFAVAYAGVIEHPAVSQVLQTAAGELEQPRAVQIPIADLLGPDGHVYCSAYRLIRDWDESRAIRKEWATARAEGRDLSSLPEPQIEQIPTFEDGTVVVRFALDPGSQRFYVGTMFVQPPPDAD
jgi:hypothetical protein